ncbi:LOW QUALITY PROTEIN: hydroxyacylglutathione hydrolase-like protein [Phyllostomus discolor]|uniref:LOW QUALITY PROTEIN: hydroxyacylglutathione hydrolase-like protein n=1 Tax=Phyllostomus discolor TaxID=89673 RepID=A0A7E6DAJ3_9CHIR|nr:LOW QUALITY PROTEIN: hydroxyacylglutathione hydrolase-like protein [Phyllostomus discolor]
MLNVKAIPVLEDNYMYLIIKEHTRLAVAKDMTMLKRQLEIVGWKGVSLTTILTIHHHWTRSKDMQRWSYLWPGLVLDANEHICALTYRLEHGEKFPMSTCLGGPEGCRVCPPNPPPICGSLVPFCVLPPEAQPTSSYLSYFLWEDKCPRPACPLLQYRCPASTCSSFSDPSPSNWHLERTAQQMYQSLAETLGTLPQESEWPVPSPFLGSSLLAQPTGCAPNLCQEDRAGRLAGALRQGHSKDLQLYSKRGGDDMPSVPSPLGEELLHDPFRRLV